MRRRRRSRRRSRLCRPRRCPQFRRRCSSHHQCRPNSSRRLPESRLPTRRLVPRPRRPTVQRGAHVERTRTEQPRDVGDRPRAVEVSDDPPVSRGEHEIGCVRGDVGGDRDDRCDRGEHRRDLAPPIEPLAARRDQIVDSVVPAADERVVFVAAELEIRRRCHDELEDRVDDPRLDQAIEVVLIQSTRARERAGQRHAGRSIGPGAVPLLLRDEAGGDDCLAQRQARGRVSAVDLAVGEPHSAGAVAAEDERAGLLRPREELEDLLCAEVLQGAPERSARRRRHALTTSAAIDGGLPVFPQSGALRLPRARSIGHRCLPHDGVITSDEGSLEARCRLGGAAGRPARPCRAWRVSAHQTRTKRSRRPISLCLLRR